MKGKGRLHLEGMRIKKYQHFLNVAKRLSQIYRNDVFSCIDMLYRDLDQVLGL